MLCLPVKKAINLMRKLLPLAEAACVLCVCLLALLLAGQWLNLSRHTAGASANATTDCANNLKQLNNALIQYSQDYDECLPPMQNAQVFQAAVRPFATSSAVFYCPDTGLPYTPDAAFSGKALTSFSGDYDTIELVQDSQPHADGLYTVLFLGGTVQHGGQIVGDPNDIVVSRAKQLGLAVTEYTQDNDELLPPMQNPEAFQTALAPYTHSHAIFYAPNGKPFLPNADLSGVYIATIAHPSSTLLLTDQAPYVSGAPTLAYLDGHVVHTPLFSKHILWTSTNGTASVWNLSDPNPAASAHLYGPYPGWTARAIAEGTNGSPRLFWTSTSGQASLWNLADANPSATCHLYGPYAGWTAKALAVGPDNAAHLLWNNKSGQVSLWNVDSAGGYTFTYAGPYSGWSGTAISYGADGKERLLWNNVNGQASLWNLSDANPAASSLIYGPYGGWSAVSISASR